MACIDRRVEEVLGSQNDLDFGAVDLSCDLDHRDRSGIEGKRFVPPRRTGGADREPGATHMALKRPVIGIFKMVARIVGWLLIVLAILGLPQMRFLTGSLEGGFQLVSSLALVIAGVAWLVVVELFLRFFDGYLSRN
jgi:hypothetical protein